MRSVAFVTYHELPHLTEDDRLVSGYLDRQGLKSRAVIWDSGDVRWEEFDCVVVRSCWEYHLRAEEFLAWINRMEAMGIPLWNPAQVMRSNMDKVYLKNLAEKGIAVAPSVWLEVGATLNLEAVLRERGWEQAVIKPTISMTAYQTWITSPSQARAGDEAAAQEILKTSGLMIQKFIAEVRTTGEWSFVFFNKKYSHAVLKRAKQGDFRVQNDFGGYLDEAMPSRELIEQAEKILSLIDEPLLFARVDGINVDGTLVLMELELIDPVLFLGSDPQAPQRFADAIMSTI